MVSKRAEIYRLPPIYICDDCDIVMEVSWFSHCRIVTREIVAFGVLGLSTILTMHEENVPVKSSLSILPSFVVTLCIVICD